MARVHLIEARVLRGRFVDQHRGRRPGAIGANGGAEYVVLALAAERRHGRRRLLRAPSTAPTATAMAPVMFTAFVLAPIRN
jgi:hypothetical protein